MPSSLGLVVTNLNNRLNGMQILEKTGCNKPTAHRKVGLFVHITELYVA